MGRTGANFEINTESFTLENMFAMELQKHTEVIEEIVTCAVKELGIEKVSRFIFLFFLYSKPAVFFSNLTLFVSGLPGSEGGGDHMGKHEVQCHAIF